MNCAAGSHYLHRPAREPGLDSGRGKEHVIINARLRKNVIQLLIATLPLSVLSFGAILRAEQLTVVQEKAPMFKEPSISAPIIKYLEKGAKVNLLATEGSFYMVSYGGYEGWVIPYSVRADSADTRPPTQNAGSAALADAAPPAAVSEEMASGRYLVVLNRYANVREGPGLEYKVVGQVFKGQKLEKFIKRGNWYRVRLPDSKIGFIREDLVGAPSGVENTALNLPVDKATANTAGGDSGRTLEDRVARLENEVAGLRKQLQETQALLIEVKSSGKGLSVPGLEGESGVSKVLEAGMGSRNGKPLIIGNKATKVYHLPESVFYDKIPEEFRVYFYTEEQARQAGFVKSIK